MLEFLVIDGPEKGLRFNMETKTAYVGRSRKCDFRIKDFTVSRRHLRCTCRENELTLEDLSSVNGTVVDGRRIQPGEPIFTCPGAMIRLGTTTITLRKLTKHTLDPALKEKVYSGSNHRSRDRRHVEVVNDITLLVADRTHSIYATAGAVLERTLRYLSRMDRAALFVYLPGKRTLKKLASQSKLENGDSFVCSMHTVERTIREGTSVTLLDIGNGGRLDSKKGGGNDIRSLLCLPLFRKTEPIGALYVDAIRESHGFRKSDVALMEHLCALVSVYLQREFPGILGQIHE